jgi:23S rRNA pseudouridine1911/1915/1917 synthase
MNNKFIAEIEDKQKRLDVFLCEKIEEYSRSRIKKLIDENKVFVNGLSEKSGKIIKIGDEVTVIIEEAKPLNLSPQNIPIDIIFEDDSFAVINKPQGLTVHAGNGTNEETLVNALLYHLISLSGINGVMRPGIVHRIDKDTSGLLVVAKNDISHLSLSKQIETKTCNRYYKALVEGIIKEDSGKIETFIGRHKTERIKMAVLPSGRKAITNYKVLKRYESGFTLVEFKLETGRTHQIRVHSKYIGYPIVGDKVYGIKKQKFNLEGQLLHAYKLELNHPVSGERMSFTAPLPNYFENVLNKLK